MSGQMNIHEIMETLPHRYPFLLVDRVAVLGDDLGLACDWQSIQPKRAEPVQESALSSWGKCITQPIDINFIIVIHLLSGKTLKDMYPCCTCPLLYRP